MIFSGDSKGASDRKSWRISNLLFYIVKGWIALIILAGTFGAFEIIKFLYDFYQ